VKQPAQFIAGQSGSDSTWNGNNLTNNNGLSPMAGQIGGGGCSPVGGYLGTAALPAMSSYTYSLWVNLASVKCPERLEPSVYS
jgi:hypothetical protein